MLPPDGFAEPDANPLVIGKPGPAYYPSGYFSDSTGQGWDSNHRISFLYPAKRGNDAIACQGQSIDLPGGRYQALHLLATATSGGAPVTADFSVVYDGGSSRQLIAISDWSKPVPKSDATTAFACSYRLAKDSVDSASACILGDYVIPLDPGKDLRGLRLPSDPRIKIMAITVEK